MTTTAEGYVIEPKSEQDLRQLAVDIIEGRVFGTWNVQNDREIPLVFMCIALGVEIPRNFGHAYEYLDKAERRGINGLPSFFSHKWLAQEDIEPLHRLVTKLREAKAAFIGITDVGPESGPSGQE